MKSITIKDLSFYHNELFVLQNINFTVNEGDFVSFLGPSGCGKTTLLHIIAGLLKTESNIKNTFNSHSLVFQNDNLLDWKNVLDNVLLPIELNKHKPSGDEIKKAKYYINLVGLKGYEDFYPNQLSGGMRKRVELARSLIKDSDLLILDEPFSSLDIITREKLNILVKKICKETKKTAILVTHSVEEACFLSNKVYTMSLKPSSIISEHIINKENTNNNSYLLTEEENKAEQKIRNGALLLWESGEHEIVSETNPKIKKNIVRHIGKSIFYLSYVTMIFFLLFVIKKIFNIKDHFLPDPFNIMERFITTIYDKSIFIHIEYTLLESLSGFMLAFIISLFFAYIIFASRKINKIIMPFLIGANTIPSIAIAPFLVLWFGFGIFPKILVSVIIIFFPMLINNIHAFEKIKLRFKNLISIEKPNIFFKIFKLEIPGALPDILNGVKVSITLSVIGAVVGEFVSGHKGLGSLVNIAKVNLDTELMFVALIWLIILGLSYYSVGSFFYNLSKKYLRESEYENNY